MVEPTTAEAPRDLSYFVVIAAGAGGLAALERFFRSVSGGASMAFAVIPHQPPRSDARIEHLLVGMTSLPVDVAAAGMAVEADRVYVVPRSCGLSVAGGRFVAAGEAPSRPADDFFACVAAEYGRRAAAVVLSGAGDDGQRRLLGAAFGRAEDELRRLGDRPGGHAEHAPRQPAAMN